MACGIRAKLYLGCGVMLLLIAMVWGVGWRATSAVSSNAHSLYDNNVQAAVQLGKAQNALWQLQYGFPQFMVLGAEALAKIVADEAKWYQQIEEAFKAYTAGSRTLEEQQALREWEDAFTKYVQARPRWFELYGAGKTEEAAEWRAQTTPYGAAAVKALGQLLELQQQTGTERQHAATALVQVLQRVQVGLFGLAIVIGLGMAFFLARRIAKPIQQVAKAANRIAVGDIDQQIDHQSKDETGTLANAFRGLIDYIKNLAAAMETLSRGDLSAQVTTRSAQDTLSHNFMKTNEALRGLLSQTGALVTAAKAGRLDRRGTASTFQGAYSDLVQGLNETLDAITAPLTEATATMERVAARDLRARIQGDYQGDFASIKRALNTAVANLDEGLVQVTIGAQQVTAASAQINSGSQALAQGASEQASTLQEVSSSLQELSAMSQQNAANAQEARSLADHARHSADTGTTNMQRLSQAIDEIKKASDETAKIVKTIDESAFQTNLLALNAAVEAARAGDAGKGFAVVAEEVRNLAMRSAEAAKTTAQRIEEAVGKAEDGVTLNQEVLRNLEDIVSQVHKVTEVMGEIAVASEQQQHGITQLNTAVRQLNQVTQQTAANAEEAASTAEELSSQALEMQHLVGTFQLSRTAAGAPQALPTTVVQAPTPRPLPRPALPARALARTKMQHGHGHAAPVVPEEIIPFDKDDTKVLRDF
jgi:methyl-accepting chemotaxis protein